MPRSITEADRKRMRDAIARGAAILEAQARGTTVPPGMRPIGSFAEDNPEIQGHPELGPESFPDFDPGK